MSENVRELVIIGSGPAGYTAALYSARANLHPLVYAGYQYGGQLMITTEVENFPGWPDGIQGPEIMEKMRAQAEKFGAEMRDVDVTSVDFSNRPFAVTDDNGETVYAKAVIVATGASAKWLGIPGEEQFRGYGVSSCATCDGFFFRDKKIVVVGGGDTALEEATFLTRFASDLKLVHRRDSLRASKAMQDRAFKNDKISFVWSTAVEEVLGDKDPNTGALKVTGLKTKNLETGDTEVIEADALFVAIGHEPNTAIFRGQLPLDDAGYAVVAGETTMTSIPGVFVAGDVRDKRYRQAITASAEGCKAAMDAERWLEEQGDTEVDLSAEIYPGEAAPPYAEVKVS